MHAYVHTLGLCFIPVSSTSLLPTFSSCCSSALYSWISSTSPFLILSVFSFCWPTSVCVFSLTWYSFQDFVSSSAVCLSLILLLAFSSCWDCLPFRLVGQHLLVFSYYGILLSRFGLASILLLTFPTCWLTSVATSLCLPTVKRVDGNVKICHDILL